jgi:hypothetical protein
MSWRKLGNYLQQKENGFVTELEKIGINGNGKAASLQDGIVF